MPLSDRSLEVLAEARSVGNDEGLAFPSPTTGRALTNLLKPDVLVMEPERPRYRDWATEHPTVTGADPAVFNREVVHRAAETINRSCGAQSPGETIEQHDCDR